MVPNNETAEKNEYNFIPREHNTFCTEGGYDGKVRMFVFQVRELRGFLQDIINYPLYTPAPQTRSTRFKVGIFMF